MSGQCCVDLILPVHYDFPHLTEAGTRSLPPPPLPPPAAAAVVLLPLASFYFMHKNHYEHLTLHKNISINIIC